jgi:8-oxo-dGTP pyrophosphatase MutT (NUDIX family)
MVKTRLAARIFLINADNEIFLLQVKHPDAFSAANPIGTYWITPGGEIEAGETTEQAARRELYEETGITDAEFVTPHAFYSEVELIHKGHPTLFKEWYFIARTQTSTISTENFTEAEKVVIGNHKWWSVGELRATTDIFFPSNLVEIVEPFVSASE